MVKVGDILVGHYGYSMEIYDFYLVTKKTAKTVILQQIEKKQIGGDGFRPVVTPKLEVIGSKVRCYLTGEVITRRIKDGKNYVNDKSGYGIIYLDNLTEEQIAKGFQEGKISKSHYDTILSCHGS